MKLIKFDIKTLSFTELINESSKCLEGLKLNDTDSIIYSEILKAEFKRRLEVEYAGLNLQVARIKTII